MTLEEIKKQTLALIEELNEDSEYLTDDPDIAAKLNYVINQIQIELAQIKRIKTKHTYTVTTETLEQDLPSDFYQVDKVNECDYEIIDNKIVFDSSFSGTATLYYYKYPEKIDENTEDSHSMELSLDCLNAIPYGVASDLLKSDPSVDYTIYANRYNELKNQLRLSASAPMIYISSTEDYS